MSGQAVVQRGSGDGSLSDPRGTEAGGHAGLLVGDEAGSIAMWVSRPSSESASAAAPHHRAWRRRLHVRVRRPCGVLHCNT